MKKIIKLVVEIDVDKDFNLDELVVGKYFDEDNSKVLLSEGEFGDKKYFSVKEYLKVEDITTFIEDRTKEAIAIQHLEHHFDIDDDYQKEFDSFTKEEQKDIEENVNKLL